MPLGALESPSQALRRSLVARIEGILTGAGGALGKSTADLERVPTGWDSWKEGLRRGAVHEWFGGRSAVLRRGWTPPLAVLTHLAWQALPDGEAAGGRQVVLWIGRRTWPYPRTLVRDFEVREEGAPGELAWVPTITKEADPTRLLRCSLLVDPPDRGTRLWAIDAALRCPSVIAVVADTSELDMASTRRLQLSAEAGSGLGLFARPPWEERELSAATTRWRIRRAHPVEGSVRPRWTLKLLRCKRALGGGEDLGGARMLWDEH